MRSPDVKHSSKHNGGKTLEDIEAEIDQTRAEMSHTLHELEKKLSPGQLMDEVLSYLRSGPGEFAQNLGTSVKENPLPIALIASGIGWLMMSGSNKVSMGDTSTGVAEKMGTIRDMIKGKASDISGRVSEAASLRQRATEIAQGAQESTGRLSDTMKRQTSRLSDIARYQTEKASTSINSMLHEQPLVVAAIGVAIGAAIGSSLPITEEENRLMGEKRDELMKMARDTGQEQLQKVQSVAQKAAEAAKSEAQQQGIAQSGESLPH